VGAVATVPRAYRAGMDTRELLTDAFQRIPPFTHMLADGADADLLRFRPDPDANHLTWLLWHAARVQDDHVAEVAGREQVWTSEGWADRFGLPMPPSDTGYGYSRAQVDEVRIDDPTLLTGYQDAVAAMVDDYLAKADEGELDRIVDEAWDPPVTAGVRLVSVLGDVLMHLGQAGYVKGLYQRRDQA